MYDGGMANRLAGHPVRIRLIKLIVKERVARQLTKYALAQRSGVSPQMIGYLESGERVPSVDVICRITDALGIPLSDLVRQAEKRE